MDKMMVRADVVKNRLYLTLVGFFSDEEMKQGSDQVIEFINKLKPGFNIINDISKFKPATPKGAEELKRAQQAAVEAGVRRTIRVIGSEGIAQMQFARKGKESGLEADVAASVEDAEKMLDDEV